jgi:hypothetical protein
MTMEKPFVTITSCERAAGGYVIRWHAPSAFLWQCVLARIRQLPERLRYRLPTGEWWLSADALPWLREIVVNYDDALGTAWHRPERSAARPPASVVRAFSALHLATSAPPVVIRAAHRALRQKARSAVDVAPETVATWDAALRMAIAWAERDTGATAA